MVEEEFVTPQFHDRARSRAETGALRIDRGCERDAAVGLQKGHKRQLQHVQRCAIQVGLDVRRIPCLDEPVAVIPRGPITQLCAQILGFPQQGVAGPLHVERRGSVFDVSKSAHEHGG
jgi:hypothetical protein